jgi:hypothetical protein
VHVEVDQSGKIGNSKQDVVLAFANQELGYSVLIPASVQRAFLQEMRGKVSKKVYTKLFAVALYLLLHKHISLMEQVLIDIEYPGQEIFIKEHLYNLFRRSGIHTRHGQIEFGYITKKSPAHRLALETYRGNQPADFIITLADLLAEF